jgi:hypothetical protein
LDLTDFCSKQIIKNGNEETPLSLMFLKVISKINYEKILLLLKEEKNTRINIKNYILWHN